MIKIKALITAIIISALFSCEKESECEAEKISTITISNSSPHPYDFYVDDVHQIRLGGNQISQEITINEGNSRKLYAEQVSGYLIYPTTKTNYFNVLRCSDYSWQIP